MCGVSAALAQAHAGVTSPTGLVSEEGFTLGSSVFIQVTSVDPKELVSLS